MSIKVEVCIDSYSSAKSASDGGAHRLEVCSSLALGGLTPPFGLVKQILKNIDIDSFVMLRPRSGDFLYSLSEFEIIKSDLELFKNLGVNGFVVGILKADGSVDVDRISEIVELANPLPVTFHRAIDMCVDPIFAVGSLAQIGVKRILTSGGENSAFLGKSRIRSMVEAADGRLEIIAGSGVTPDNVAEIIDFARVREVHFSGGHWEDGNMEYRSKELRIGNEQSDYGNKVANVDLVQEMLESVKHFQ